MVSPEAQDTLPGKNIAAPAGLNEPGFNISILYRKIQPHASVSFRLVSFDLAQDQNDP